MFKMDKERKMKFERYDQDGIVIKSAEVGTIFEIGDEPRNNEPTYCSYQEEDFIDYLYAFDYIVMVKNQYIIAYQIGICGMFTEDNEIASKDQYVYDIKDLFYELCNDDEEEYQEFGIFMDYLTRFAIDNDCVALILKKDDKNRYELFYKTCIEKLGFKESETYIYKKVK